jgi:hypothetical protein
VKNVADAGAALKSMATAALIVAFLKRLFISCGSQER